MGLLRGASVVNKQSFKKSNDPLPNSKWSQVLARVLALGGCTRRYGNMICFMFNQKNKTIILQILKEKQVTLNSAHQRPASKSLSATSLLCLGRLVAAPSWPPGCHCLGPNLPLPPPQATVVVNPTRHGNLVVWLHWLLICRSIDHCQVYFEKEIIARWMRICSKHVPMRPFKTCIGRMVLLLKWKVHPWRNPPIPISRASGGQCHGGLESFSGHFFQLFLQLLSKFGVTNG